MKAARPFAQPMGAGAGTRLRAARHPALARGFTLVELMVALVIGSLIAVAAASLAFSFDNSRKALLASNNATGSGAAAMAALSAQVAMSGAGLISNGVQYCQRLYVSGVAPIPLDPLVIDHVSNPNSDQVAFAFAAGGSAAALLAVPAPLASLTADIPVSSVGAVNAQDQVLFAFDTDGTFSCALRRVTSLTGPAANTPGPTVLHFGTDTLNGALGTALNFGSGSYVVPVGTLRLQRWFAQDGVLHQQDLLTGKDAQVADGVLTLRAQYGIDTGNGLNWTDLGAPASPALTPTQLAGLRSVRMALVARTGDRERQRDPALCTTTTNPVIALSDAWVGVTVDVSALKNSAGTALVPDWQCYSYRTYTSVQPLRNVIWGTPT